MTTETRHEKHPAPLLIDVQPKKKALSDQFRQGLGNRRDNAIQ